MSASISRKSPSTPRLLLVLTAPKPRKLPASLEIRPSRAFYHLARLSPTGTFIYEGVGEKQCDARTGLEICCFVLESGVGDSYEMCPKSRFLMVGRGAGARVPVGMAVSVGWSGSKAG